jgi:predicted O-methyltransferase YrrM
MIKVASVRESFNYLQNALLSSSKVFYTRFGDGVFEIIQKKDDASHKFSHQLKSELEQALSMQHPDFIKAAVLGYPKEPGMKKRVFIEGSVEGSWPQRYIETVLKYSDDKLYHNPILFHYLSVFKPALLRNFVKLFVRPKAKMFIGCCPKKDAEAFYGPIDFYIKTPEKQAYHFIDEWWPQVEKNAENVELVLPSAGLASKVISKRLWELKKNIQLIDIGSVNNILENRNRPAWIKVIGLKTLRKNLLDSAPKEVDPHYLIKKTLKIKEGYSHPYVGKRRKQDRRMMYRIFDLLGYKKGAEIGVFQAINALDICESIPGVQLICIDPWEKMFHYSQKRMNGFFQQCKEKLQNYNVEFIRAASFQACQQIKDGSLDFVHIDARHDFNNVMTDLIQWVPKVRSGGAVSGHDFFFDGGCGVIQAVNAYTQAHNIGDIYLINDTKGRPSFFWVKK